MSCEELSGTLRDVEVYEVEFDAKTYQVEVLLLENTNGYIHVMVSVDDGSLLGATLPLAESFICNKERPPA